MYIPYFRGKQYDLLGLMESIHHHLIPDNVIPLIEPVRDSKYLIQLLDLCVEHKKKILVVVNPEVGQIPYGVTSRYPYHAYFSFEEIVPVFILNDTFTSSMVEYHPYVFLSNRYSKQAFLETQEMEAPLFYITTEDPMLKNRIDDKRVKLVDPFVRRKDQMYEEEEIVVDEFFSDEWYYLKEDGYVGYADYGIDGAAYYDKGYPSKYVVLHILYLDRYQRIRVKHFVNDTADSFANPGQKFFQSLTKCKEWYDRNQDVVPLTVGLARLFEYLIIEKYPGAGIVKKLLIMHHMEVVGNFSGIKKGE